MSNSNKQIEIGTIFSFNDNRSRMYVVVEVTKNLINVYEIYSELGIHFKGIRTLALTESSFRERCHAI